MLSCLPTFKCWNLKFKHLHFSTLLTSTVETFKDIRAYFREWQETNPNPLDPVQEPSSRLDDDSGFMTRSDADAETRKGPEWKDNYVKLGSFGTGTGFSHIILFNVYVQHISSTERKTIEIKLSSILRPDGFLCASRTRRKVFWSFLGGTRLVESNLSLQPLAQHKQESNKASK